MKKLAKFIILLLLLPAVTNAESLKKFSFFGIYGQAPNTPATFTAMGPSTFYGGGLKYLLSDRLDFQLSYEYQRTTSTSVGFVEYIQELAWGGFNYYFLHDNRFHLYGGLLGGFLQIHEQLLVTQG